MSVPKYTPEFIAELTAMKGIDDIQRIESELVEKLILEEEIAKKIKKRNKKLRKLLSCLK